MSARYIILTVLIRAPLAAFARSRALPLPFLTFFAHTSVQLHSIQHTAKKQTHLTRHTLSDRISLGKYVYIPDPHRLSTKRCDCSSRRQKRLSTTAPPMHTATVPKGMRPVAATLGFGFGFGFGFGLGLVGLGLGLGLGAHGGPRGGDRWPPPGVPQCAIRTERPRLVRVPSTYRYVSRPAPPVRAQRGRLVRVARMYPMEAPGRTCQLRARPHRRGGRRRLTGGSVRAASRP